MNGPQQAEWLDRLEAEHENLRAALACEAATPDTARGLRLCKALHRFWSGRGRHSEGRQWCARMLEAAAGSPDSDAGIATKHTLAVLAMQQQDYGVARPLLEQCAAQWRAMGNLRSASRALGNLGNILQDLGELAAAQRTYEESLAIKREIGDKAFSFVTLGNLANVVLAQGNVALARSLLEEAVAGERGLGSLENLAISLCNLGRAARKAGDLRGARLACEESVMILRA